MALCLPNVVVAELNFLKERNASPNTRALAQEANAWLLAAVRTRNGFLRGQQKHEGLEQLENDRARHIRVSNTSLSGHVKLTGSGRIFLTESQ